MSLSRAASGVAPLALFAVTISLRVTQHHTALLYPDGYQYLLMARGIGEHLQPTTTLGPGGDLFVPSPDAAVKPLFPLLVAAIHALGGSWLAAAEAVTVISAAWAVTALALLVTKLGGSTLAGLAAAALMLASPGIAFWSGFSGPDPLALALILSAALAFTSDRPGSGGAITGLAIATRPEIAVVAIAAALFSLRTEDDRRRLAKAAPPTIATTALVFGALRTPVSVTDWRLAWLLPVLLACVAALVLAPPRVVRYATLAALAAAGIALLVEPGPATVWQVDWPLILVGAAGFVVLATDSDQRKRAGAVLGVVVLLGSVYLVKNPTLDRYFTLLLPAGALLGGLAIAALPPRARTAALGVAAVAVWAGAANPVPGSRDYDMFRMVAHRITKPLQPGSEPLVTAAPDAYGFWMPDRTVHKMRPGVRGAILLDAAQRLYEPRLSAKGRLIARVSGDIAFTRPNDDIDAGPAVLVGGEVISAR
jgi:hypothetical protein